VDRAFQLAVSRGPNDPGPATARRSLASEFPDVGTDGYAHVYFEIYDFGLALLDAASDAAERFREGHITEIQALRMLRQQFPDDSARTYELAFARGLNVTR
jgi:hypothetical protein